MPLEDAKVHQQVHSNLALIEELGGLARQKVEEASLAESKHRVKASQIMGNYSVFKDVLDRLV